ncbi:MAG: hypothetical protein AAF563_11895 [Pseudomonadota bacterium]
MSSNARRYGVLAHGVGLCDEYPHVSFSDNTSESSAFSFDPGMTICVESYIGVEDGVEGVKLEEQVFDDGERPAAPVDLSL